MRVRLETNFVSLFSGFPLPSSPPSSHCLQTVVPTPCSCITRQITGSFRDEATRRMLAKEEPRQRTFFFISPDTRLAAKEIAKGWDIDHVEQEWRSWVFDQNKGTPKNPDKAFLGFCKKWQASRGRP